MRDLVAPTLDGTSWYAWASDNTRLQRTRLRELIRIADADDPRAEAAHLRQLNARRQLKHRKSLTRYLPRENRTLINWARKASRKEAAAVLRDLRDKALRAWGIDDPALQ